ncbi:hypothetical protein HW132_16475 [Brasilonema sp. CT11]|nr:hypothetical protein [Brasilonema sp. CT11]
MMAFMRAWWALFGSYLVITHLKHRGVRGASAVVRQSGLGEPLHWAALPTCSMWRGFPHEELPKGFPDLRHLAL